MKRATDDPRNEIQPAKAPRANSLRLNNRNSNIGEQIFSSHQMKNTKRANERIEPVVIVAEAQPSRWPLLTTKRKNNIAAPDNIAPIQSNVGLCSLWPG